MGRRSDHSREELRKLILNAAREIVRADGVGAISSRKIAKKIGYTVGTIFQVCGSMDELIAQMNIQTLDGLYAECLKSANTGDAEKKLRSLAGAFLEFAGRYPNEWNAIISYQYTTDQTDTDEYQRRISNLLALLARATSEFYGPDQARQHDDHVRLLWTSIYGIFSLNAASRLTRGYDAQKMVDVLIELYIESRD